MHFKLRVDTNIHNPRSCEGNLSGSEKGLKDSGLNGTPTLSSAMPVQCSTS